MALTPAERSVRYAEHTLNRIGINRHIPLFHETERTKRGGYHRSEWKPPRRVGFTERG